jgi:hypothetical protein
VGHDFQDVIPTHRPTKVKDAVATARVVHFLPIGNDDALSGRDRPHQSDIVLFPTAGGSSLSVRNGFLIRKSKTPEAGVRHGGEIHSRGKTQTLH